MHIRKILVIPALLLAPWTAVQAGAERRAFTIDQVMSAPFPTNLVTANGAGKVAWIFNERGIRNVWVAEPPGYVGRPVTAYTEDDGQDLYGLQWVPGGGSLVYVRGGEEEMGGEYPNPRGDPKGTRQEVWLVPAGKGQPRALGEGHSPRVAPTGEGVAFLFKGQVWWAPVGRTGIGEQFVHVRGNCTVLRWSPDGSKLAFVCNRKDHSLIGVYDRGTKTLRWLDPSVDRDSSPVWSPDGKQIAFVRVSAALARLTARFFVPWRTAAPWSVRVAEASTGEGRLVWKAKEGAGSGFHRLEAEDQLFWGAGDRLVFPWERDGWCHLYAVAVTGGPATLLTPGAFEVEYASLSPDRTRVVFNSNQGDIDRRHLWTVPVSGGPPKAVTSGRGIEWSPAITANGKATAFLGSDARQPAQPFLKVAAEVRNLATGSIPTVFPADALVEPQPVLFPAADGIKIHGQLFLPRNIAKGERRPAILFMHGGSRRQMLLGWHYMGYYHNAYALNQYLAGRGYVVLSVNYRSGIGYGMKFREALNYGAAGASEFNDVLGAGLYLRGRRDVDAKRIGLYGGSYGGYLTALGLARASDLFAAGVDIHGVYDWNVVLRNFFPEYDPRAQQEIARRAFESSPAASVKTWRSPVLVIHGDDDRNVPFRETVRLVEELRQQKVDVEQLIFPDEVHDFLTHARWLQAYHAAADFFDRRLKNSGPKDKAEQRRR
jgi:dipeptidyl aminopeptidase/acylaminoacyl peptidase